MGSSCRKVLCRPGSPATRSQGNLQAASSVLQLPHVPQCKATQHSATDSTVGADLADESTLAGSGLNNRRFGRASVRLQRTQRRCWQVQAEERPDSDPHSPDRAVSRNQEPQGSTVVLYASALLLIAFVVPRIVTMGMLGIERSLVTTLLGFEELLTQALFSAAKWVGIALLFAFTLNVFVAIMQAAFNRRE